MASKHISFHIESGLQANGRRIPFFIMGPADPNGGTTDEPAYGVYPLDEEWDFDEDGPLPTIYDNMTIEDARTAVLGLCDALHDIPA